MLSSIGLPAGSRANRKNMVAVIDVAGETHRLEMAEYRSENGFIMLDAAIMLLSADLAPAYNASNEGTFCCAKRSSSAT